MADNWDDDDEWDADDDEIDKKLGLKKSTDAKPAFDDEEDLALQEKQQADAAEHAKNKAKGTALAAKKKAEQDKKDQLEIARRAAELEALEEANMTSDELKLKERMRIEQADNDNISDLFGGIDESSGKGVTVDPVSGDKLVLKDLPSHLKHARKVATAMKVSATIVLKFKSYFGFGGTFLLVNIPSIFHHWFTFSNFFPLGTWKNLLDQGIHWRTHQSIQRHTWCWRSCGNYQDL